MLEVRVREALKLISPFWRRVFKSVPSVSFPWNVGTTFLIIVLLLSSLLFFSLWRVTTKQLDNPTEVARREARKVAGQVGKLMELPPGEEPTVATITDATRLARLPFFAKAKNGNRVLIYNNARLAILYDPVAQKIINVGTVSLGTNPMPAVDEKQLMSTSSADSGL